MNKSRINLMAVIELGTTSIRMVIAQNVAHRSVKYVDELEHAVSLGSDALASGAISSDTTERCVKAISSFNEVLAEFGIEHDDVRVVATSAVREARNKDRFCDRIFIATGLKVEVLEQADISRLIYRAVQPRLRPIPFFRKSDVIVVEVGGGSTETLMFSRGTIATTHLYRIGSLRLRTQIEKQEIPTNQVKEVAQEEVARILSQISLPANTKTAGTPKMVLLGSEARYACSALGIKTTPGKLSEVRLDDLKKILKTILSKSVDQLIKKYELTYAEAETFGPSLLIATMMAEKYRLKRLYVCDISLRTGVLLEMATGEGWTTEYRRQIISSSMIIAKTHRVDLKHAKHVAKHGLDILHALQTEFEFSARDEIIYHVAALLHEVGRSVNTTAHHKHSQYIIMNSDIFGLGQRNTRLASLVARYHRKALPQPRHTEYMNLNDRDRITVSKLTAIIRLANALDQQFSARYLNSTMKMKSNQLIIEISGNSNLPTIQQKVNYQSRYFREIFGKKIILLSKRKQSNE